MGMIGKYKVIFDTADPATSDNIGAYLRASDGTLLTHTDVGGKKSLDVNVANSITTTNAANYAEDDPHSTGAIGTHVLAVRNDVEGALAGTDGDYASLQLDASGRLRTYATIVDGGGSITVDATNLDIRDLTHVSDSVKIGDGTDFLAVAADGSIAVTDNGGSLTVDGTVAATQSGTWNIGTVTSITNTVTVSATDLDIRDLTHVSDSVKVGDGTDFLGVNGDGSINVVATATNLDIRDLTHASDSVKVGDGTDFWAIDSTGLGRVADYHTAAANSAVSIDTTAGGTAIVGSALLNRTAMFVQNNGNKDIYVGVGTVTAANGLRLVPGSVLEARIGSALSLKAIADSGTQDVRVLELA